MHRTRTSPGERRPARAVARVAVLGLVLTGTVAFARIDTAVAPPAAAEVSAAVPNDSTLVDRSAETASRSLAERPALLTVELDSGTQEVSADGTVRDVLDELGVVLEPGAVLSHDLDETVVDGMEISARTPEASTEVVEESVAYETQEVEDPNLVKGRRVVATSGVEGRSTTTYLVRSVGGVEVERTEVASVVISEVRDEVVRVGTMELPDASASVLSPAQARALAKSMVADRGWDEAQYVCLDKLWTKESNWRVQAANSSSGAYGIPQSLPGSKMGSVAADWRTNAETQITWGLGYISGRYGTPCGAWSASQAKGWY